jgi:hypothetical protein
MPDDALPPASCSEPWAAVAGDESAHKFPAGRDAALCGLAGPPLGPASNGVPSVRAGRLYRKLCPRCRELNGRRWLLAYPRGGVT